MLLPRHPLTGQMFAPPPMNDGVTYLEQERGYETPCWIWQGLMAPTGYGRRGDSYAHRIYYERHKGPIPEGLTLDHLCRQRDCVNPAHLEPVTRAENCRRGAKTTLTWDDVSYIRASAEGPTALGRRFGVSARHISHIRKGQRWAVT